MNQDDSFTQNILGVTSLIESGINKTNENETTEEDVGAEEFDVLELPMSDEELLALKEEWEGKHNGYYPKIKPRQDKNKTYYVGKQRNPVGTQDERVVPSNLIFEAEETFIPQALSQNPEPVVFSDNTEEGKDASNALKTMLQYHADVLCLRKKLGVMVRHWSIYFLAVVKHGWDEKLKDIKLEIRKPQNLVLDPDGYIDEYGNYIGAFLGERIETTAKKLIDLFPSSKDYISEKVGEKLGTSVTYTEWWTDDYCFSTFFDKVLDKHKNEYFNYPDEKSDSATPTINHFGVPKMPYTFLSVFSLQEHPHDITNLIEQSIPNQNRINDRDAQISKNLGVSNNSLALSMLHGWNSENAREGAQAVEDGDPILVPGEIDAGIKRLPANPLPNGILDAQQEDKETLRSVFGTSGLSSQTPTPEQTARGQILNTNHDSTRIGGGIGDALEQVADNIFNWQVQLYCVFYDEPHYAAIMGNGQAVEYVSITNENMQRKYVVSVAPNSMRPKDEVSEQNLALERWNNKAIDPIGFMKAINDPDPMNSAKRLVLWTTNPQAYAQLYFPEQPQPTQNTQQGGSAPPQEQGTPPASLSAPPASSSLSQVPISTSATPQ